MTADTNSDQVARRRDAGLLRALKTPPKSHKEMAEERAKQTKRKAKRKSK